MPAAQPSHKLHDGVLSATEAACPVICWMEQQHCGSCRTRGFLTERMIPVPMAGMYCTLWEGMGT